MQQRQARSPPRRVAEASSAPRGTPSREADDQLEDLSHDAPSWPPLLLALASSVVYPVILTHLEAPAGACFVSQICASISVAAFLWCTLHHLVALPALVNSKICSQGQICGYVMAIHVYPIKSCAGNSVSQRKIDRYGFVGDRRLMVVRATPDSIGAHAFVTQRQIAAMARIVCSELEAGLLLSFPDRPPLRVPQAVPNARRIRVRVWEDNQLYAADLGDEPAAWISNVLGTSCRLVSANIGSWSRKLSAEYVPWHLRWFIRAPQVGFADGYPFLLTSEASLSELNSRIGCRPQASSELPMSRFRPNIVVSGCKAFAEDTWRRIRIGELEFYSVKGCSRCKITTTDQETGEVGGLLGVDGVTAEPLATLSSFRKFNDNVYFGQNLVHAWPIPCWRRLRLYIQGKTQQPYSIRVGDLVQELLALRCNGDGADARFLDCWDEEGCTSRLSFREFGARVQLSTVYLREIHICKGTHVGMLAHNSVEFWVCSMSIICCGAVCVLLNYRQPSCALASMANAANVTRLLASSSLQSLAIQLKSEAHGIDAQLVWLCDIHTDIGGDAKVPMFSSFAANPRPDPHETVLIFFTSGSTSTPKPVAHSHASLLWSRKEEANWLTRQLGHVQSNTAEGNSFLCFAPGFHVLGFCMHFLMALYTGSRLVDDAGCMRRPLTAELVARAVAEARPTVVSLAVVLWQRLAGLLNSGEVERGAFASVRLAVWGGAQLSARTATTLRSYGIPLLATYGQTETCAYALVGRLDETKSYAAMLPLSPHVSYLLRQNAPSNVQGHAMRGIGELVLVGYFGARRSGALATSASESERVAQHYSTGDLFKEVVVDGQRMLEHVCRADDVLAHTSGEMTNPIPIEAAIIGVCAEHFSCVCLIGAALPRPVLVTELQYGLEMSPSAETALRAGILEANRASPAYSAIRAEYVITVAPPRHAPLPRTAKGNVRRGATHRRFAHQLARWFGEAGVPQDVLEALEDENCILGCQISRDGLQAEEQTLQRESTCNPARVDMDSLQGSVQVTPSTNWVVASHMYLVAMSLVLLHHMTKLKETCGHFGRGLSALEALGEAAAMPLFCLLAGVSDNRQPSAAAMRKLAATTSILFAICLYMAYYSSVPDHVHWFYRHMVFGANRGMQKAPYREYFVMHTWFMLALPVWRCLNAAARTLGIKRALPAVGVLIHFGCWGNNCRWPLLRHPHDFEESVAAYGYFSGSRRLKAFAAWLPQNDLSVIGPFTLFYATLPYLMPPDFPHSLPNPFANACGRAWTNVNYNVSRAATRALWLVSLSALLAVFSDPALLHVVGKALWHSKRAYGCDVSVFPPRALVVRVDTLAPCGNGSAGSWSFRALLLDGVGVVLSLVGVLGIAALVPRHRTAWTEAGERTFTVYILHPYILPAVEVPISALAQVAGEAIHPEAVAPIAFLCAIVLCRALALPVLELLQVGKCASWATIAIERCLLEARKISQGKMWTRTSTEQQPLMGGDDNLVVRTAY